LEVFHGGKKVRVIPSVVIFRVFSYNDHMKNEIMDVNTTKSNRPGLAGLVEGILRKFKTIGFLFALAPIALLYIIAMGLSFTPGVMLFKYVTELTQSSSFVIHSVAVGLSLAAGFFAYGLTLIFVVPAINKLLPLKVRPHRTSWFSISVLPWYYHNALTYLVRYTFLEFITPTPLNKLFFQMMGMKVGKGTMINTTNISDPCLIELGDYVTVGGSATLIAHYGMKGMLIIDKLIIEDHVTIGLRASLFGDVRVGKGATVKPNEVLLPKTRIPEYKKDPEAA
jgi:hypothetical protein